MGKVNGKDLETGFKRMTHPSPHPPPPKKVEKPRSKLKFSRKTGKIEVLAEYFLWDPSNYHLHSFLLPYTTSSFLALF